MAQAGKMAPRCHVPIFFILNDNNNDNNHNDNDNSNDGTSWEGVAPRRRVFFILNDNNNDNNHDDNDNDNDGTSWEGSTLLLFNFNGFLLRPKMW